MTIFGYSVLSWIVWLWVAGVCLGMAWISRDSRDKKGRREH